MSNQHIDSIAYDDERRSHAVTKAYYSILQQITTIVESSEPELMRAYIQLENVDGYKHQFLSPIIHLRLSEDLQTLSFAKDLELKPYIGRKHYHNLYRIIFDATKKENTEIDIEDCLDEVDYYFSDYEDALETIP